MNMPRMRGHVPQKKFADAARAARAGSNMGRFKRPDGVFDRLKLGDKPIWMRFSPDQIYAQLLYNKELKALIETGTAEWPARPWFEYTNHFIPVKKRPMICSAGAGRTQPCRGCAIRARHYANIKMREAQTSVKDEEARKNPPAQSATRYAMATTVLEKIFELPVTGQGGKPRKNKEGHDIMQFVPAPLSGLNPMKQKEMQGEFGHNFHWSFGPMHLSQLASIDTDLWNSCASCASPLVATHFNCQECQHTVYVDEGGLSGADLRAMREQSMKCPNCNTEDFLAPLLACTGCENPVEGNLLSFDLRLKLEKDMNDDKKSVVQLVQFRLPEYATLFDAATADRVFTLVYSPLDIVAICAPDSVDAQAWVLPDDLKAVDPSYHLKEKEAGTYGQEGTEPDHAVEDPDQMSFDE